MEVLRYDQRTGDLLWLGNSGKKATAGKVAGHVNCLGYVHVRIDGKLLLGHRIAWCMYYGEWPDQNIDHIDGNRSNNKIANLREASQQMNTQNRRSADKDHSIGLLGVKRHGKRFRAGIVVNGEQFHIGVYDTAEQAHSAYVDVKRVVHHGCTL
jgi:hypothetical protein